jgi:pyruvate dehydrogenase E2 component (dihydrolipoamide acetyltransferase)
MIEFRMPSLGADMEAGTLREWLVKPGDKVKRGDIIAMVETQKGLIDIEVFDEGKIEQLVIKEDEKVPVGTVMALIGDGADQAPKAAKVQPEIAAAPSPGTPEIPVRIPEVVHGIKASPLAKRIAADKGIDLSTLKGSGEGGAITREDVEKAIVERMAPKEEKAASNTESIRMAVAAAMSRSNRDIPHYYLETKADMSKALEWLRQANKERAVQQRLLPAVLLIKATAMALKAVPDLNAYWENGLQRQPDINIGFVVSLRTGGLMIPAIPHADQRSVDELMSSLNDIIPRARALKLRSSELSESTMTISNLGEGNVETMYGVIYPPQVAIVGFGGITEKPWAENGMLAVRPVLTITLAADHRATDGATGSRFLTVLKNNLQNPSSL